MPKARHPEDARSSGRSSGTEAAPYQRLDKWLWCARLLRTRSACTRFVRENALRINRNPASGPDHRLRVGDILTLMVRGRVVVWRVLALADRRGPPAEAARLYERLDAEGGAVPALPADGEGGGSPLLLHCENERRISPASRSGELD